MRNLAHPGSNQQIVQYLDWIVAAMTWNVYHFREQYQWRHMCPWGSLDIYVSLNVSHMGWLSNWTLTSTWASIALIFESSRVLSSSTNLFDIMRRSVSLRLIQNMPSLYYRSVRPLPENTAHALKLLADSLPTTSAIHCWRSEAWPEMQVPRIYDSQQTAHWSCGPAG